MGMFLVRAHIHTHTLSHDTRVRNCGRCPELLPLRQQPMSGAAMQVPLVPLPKSGYDARAVDAWALGVLLFLLIGGTYPFEVCLGEGPAGVGMYRG